MNYTSQVTHLLWLEVKDIDNRTYLINISNITHIKEHREKANTCYIFFCNDLCVEVPLKISELGEILTGKG